MSRWIVSGILALVGLLNVTPVIVFFAPSRTVDLYGIEVVGDDIEILMRHRAVILGLLGLALIFAAVKREFVVPAIVAALIGKAAFLFLVYSSSGHASEIGRVALFDIAAVVLLIAALAIHLSSDFKS